MERALLEARNQRRRHAAWSTSVARSSGATRHGFRLWYRLLQRNEDLGIGHRTVFVLLARVHRAESLKVARAVLSESGPRLSATHDQPPCGSGLGLRHLQTARFHFLSEPVRALAQET